MSRKNGQILTCDRCGAWIFLACTGEDVMDGGYTRWNKFEPAEGWDTITGVGNVCPECNQDFKELIDRFKKRPPRMKSGG